MTRSNSKQPRAGRRAIEDRLTVLERQFSPSGAPVLGLYIYSAASVLVSSLRAKTPYRSIVPSLIGTPAILSARPGISQTELARYLGTERATAGKHVAACMRRGWIRRVVSKHDRRRFSLYITPNGERMLRKLIVRCPPQP